MRLKTVILSLPAAVLLIGLGLASPVMAQGPTPPNDPGRIEVITSGSFAAALNVLGPLYEEATGIDIVISYGSSQGGGPESIPIRIGRGETFDVLIMGRASLDQLTDEGVIRPDSRVNLVMSEIGLAVRSGAPKPDISTLDAFLETMITAESIGYSASVSGTYLSTVRFPELGIWNRIESKTVRVVGERVGDVIARGDVEIGLQQVSELLPIEGIDFVGAIPAELQLESWFSAGIMLTAENPEAGERFIKFLYSEAAAPIIESMGLRPRPR
jgi:molybdate transport system substrate-binding protein